MDFKVNVHIGQVHRHTVLMKKKTELRMAWLTDLCRHVLFVCKSTYLIKMSRHGLENLKIIQISQNKE